MRRITLGVTGASGMRLSFYLLQQLLALKCRVNLVFSTAAIITVKQEAGFSLSANSDNSKQTLVEQLKLINSENLYLYANNDWFSPIASGSNVDDAMVVCPCSMASLGKIACGIGDDLITRACDVIIKERKNLLLVPREMPFSSLHLANMLKLSELGVCIMPPIPAFYTHPQSIDDIICFLISRVLDQLNIPNDLSKRWGKGE